ncbi:MAG: hypothetical protein ABW202_16910 [Duganella sp.]
MRLKQLSPDEQRDFVCMAELLSLAEKPVQEKSGESVFPFPFPISVTPRLIERSEEEQAVIDELARRCDPHGANGLAYATGGRYGHQDMAQALAAQLGQLATDSENAASNRVQAALSVLREVLDGRKASVPSAPKLMLFELMVFALAKGNITGVEWQLLKEFQHHHQLESHVFDDLLERAQCTHREAQKALAIILE